MKKLFFIVAILFVVVNLRAQIKVGSTNNVGIGSTNPLSKLTVGSNGHPDVEAFFYNPKTTGNYSFGLIAQSLSNGALSYGIQSYVTFNTSGYRNYGVWGQSYSGTALTNGRAYGIYGFAGNAAAGYNYAVYGQLAGTNNGAAIFGVVPGYGDVDTQGKYAGYFQGDVKVVSGILYTPTGTVTASDERLKKNITGIDTSERLFNLQPKKYNLKSLQEQNLVRASISGKSLTPDTAKVITIPDPNYIKKNHYGFLAQDVQSIYPDLVYQSADGTLGIDYQGFIPIIIDQLKKMKQSLNEKDAKISDLETRLARLEKLIKK